jgi:REP element-mobilizing transposase RayT
MNRGRRREDIFRDVQDFKAFVDLLKSTSEMFRVDIAACCLMSNHFHLLLQTSEANLARAMRHLGGVLISTLMEPPIGTLIEPAKVRDFRSDDLVLLCVYESPLQGETSMRGVL